MGFGDTGNRLGEDRFMKNRMFSIVIALALCLGLLPGTAWAEETAESRLHTVRTERLVLTREAQENTEEGWSWEVDADNGIFILTLDNVDFQVSDYTAITLSLSGGYTGKVSIILKGENRVASTHDTENTYDGGSIYLPVGPQPLKITISGGGSLTVEGKHYGISVAADAVEINGVTVNARSDQINGLNFNGALMTRNSNITTNTLSCDSLTAENSAITAHMKEVPYYSEVIINAKSCDISDSTLTLTGPEEKHAYAAIYSSVGDAREFNFTNSSIAVRNVEQGLYIKTETINMDHVNGTLICSEDNPYWGGRNTALFANYVNAAGCSIFAMAGSDAVVYGDCALPDDIQELTVPGGLELHNGDKFTIGEDQKVTFTKNWVETNNAGSATIINNGTLEFSYAPDICQNLLINNGTLIAHKDMDFDHNNFTNNGTYNGGIIEKTAYIR